MTSSRIVTTLMIIVSVCAIGILAKQRINTFMDIRIQNLQSEIKAIPEPTPYYMETVKIDYAALKQTFTLRPKVWNQLVPGQNNPATKEVPPYFQAILKGVIPNKRKEMKVGNTVKVHVITPEKPSGQWLGIGDEILGCKIVAIAPDYLLMEKYKGKNRYAHKLPRI